MTQNAPYRMALIERSPDDEPTFGPQNPPTPETPLGAAVLWAICALNLPGTAPGFADMTVTPLKWTQPERYASLINGRVLARGPRYGSAPGVAFVKVLPAGVQIDPDPAHKLSGSDEVIALRRCPDGWWRVARFDGHGAGH